MTSTIFNFVNKTEVNLAKFQKKVKILIKINKIKSIIACKKIIIKAAFSINLKIIF